MLYAQHRRAAIERRLSDRPCYKALAPLRLTCRLMTLVSIPANPVPDDVVTGAILKTRDGVIAALRALGAAAGPQGHGLPVPGPRRVHREIFRDRARPARARLRGRDARLARAGAVGPRAARTAARAMCGISPNTDRPRNLHAARSCCRIARRRSSRWRIRWAATVLLRAAHAGSRWFDRMVLSAPMIGLPGLRRLTPVAGTVGRAPCGCWGSAAPMFRAATRGHAAATVSSATCSPPIPCAMRATWRCSRRSRRSASAAPTVAWADVGVPA